MHPIIPTLLAAVLTGAAIPLATTGQLLPEKPVPPTHDLTTDELNDLLYGNTPLGKKMQPLLPPPQHNTPPPTVTPREEIRFTPMPIIIPPAPELAKILTAPPATNSIPLLGSSSDPPTEK